MKKTILFLLLFCGENACCQTADGLQDIIYREKTDSARIRVIYEILRHSVEIDPAQAIQLHRKVLYLAKNNKDKVSIPKKRTHLSLTTILWLNAKNKIRKLITPKVMAAY
jgi:hypothetical protein